MDTPDTAAAELADARSAVLGWLGNSDLETSSNEAIASAGVSRARQELGLVLHAHWNPSAMVFQAHWTDANGQRPEASTRPVEAEDFDLARLLACAALAAVADRLVPKTTLKIAADGA